MSIRASDLSRWPLPPSKTPQEKVRLCLPFVRDWQVMAVHAEWLRDCSTRYGFDGDVGEALRHLVYLANSEPAHVKRLIFKTIRCLHCHVGARAGQHPKVSLSSPAVVNSPPQRRGIVVHTFHHEWLERVTASCNIASIEKSVRIVIDYYQSRVKEALHRDGEEASKIKEANIFGVNRDSDLRYAAAMMKTAAAVVEKADQNQTLTADATAAVIVENDPAACSEREMLKAIERCQVGKNSASYADARGETKQETYERRAKEILAANTKEARSARILIRKTLGSVMG